MTAAELRSLVLTALGEASMCWRPRPSGVFDDVACCDVAERLIGALAAAWPRESRVGESLRQQTQRLVSQLTPREREVLRFRRGEQEPNARCMRCAGSGVVAGTSCAVCGGRGVAP